MRRKFLNTYDNTNIIILDNYLTVHALEDDFTLSYSQNCYYCIDGNENWKELSANSITPNINTGHTISFKQESNNQCGTFKITKRCNLSGNCMSMSYGDYASLYTSIKTEYVFSDLFADCTGIVDASLLKLPATILQAGCYSSMFSGCTSLTTAPELPATTLAKSCYFYMFCGCTSLTTAPKLPARILYNKCYYCMFCRCSSLGLLYVLACLNNYDNSITNWILGTNLHHFLCAIDTPKSMIPQGPTIIYSDIEVPTIVNVTSEYLYLQYTGGIYSPLSVSTSLLNNLDFSSICEFTPERTLEVIVNINGNTLGSFYWDKGMRLDQFVYNLGFSTSSIPTISIRIVDCEEINNTDGYYGYE